MNKNKNFLKIARQAALQNGPLFKKNFGKIQGTNKNQNIKDWVTNIDKKIETNIRKFIHTKFPTHKVMGEELGLSNFNRQDYVWIIDPIDGTSNYIKGIPFCCISIGLWHQNKPLLGVVYNPITNEIYEAEKNHGARYNNRRISVSKVKTLNQSFCGFGWGRDEKIAIQIFPTALKNLNKLRTLGSTAWEMCLVARGVFECRVDMRASLWDYAGACIVVLEAGGKITEVSGKPLNLKSTSIVTSNKLIHGEVLDIFKPVLAKKS